MNEEKMKNKDNTYILKDNNKENHEGSLKAERRVEER